METIFKKNTKHCYINNLKNSNHEDPGSLHHFLKNTLNDNIGLELIFPQSILSGPLQQDRSRTPQAAVKLIFFIRFH